MMPPNNEYVANISKEKGISEVTVYKWRKDTRGAGMATPGNGQISDKWNSQDKFLIVMERFAMNEVELAREKHPERWARKMRNWTPHEQVALNPMKEEETETKS